MKSSYTVILYLTLFCSLNTFALPVNPITLTVNNTNDSGAGSLRGTITGAIPGTTITFADTLSGQTIVLTNGQIMLNKSLIIDGSALNSGLVLDGNTNGRIFQVTASSTVVLDSLTIFNGSADHGGGIYNLGTLTLNRCTVANNSALYGGGVANAGSLSQLTLNNSTIAGNSSQVGGGIQNYLGTTTINGCTLSKNLASTSGGGITTTGTVSITSSIVTGNRAGTSDDNIEGSIASLVSSLTNGDPLLAPLGDYGGPTPTMPPLPGSPAIDAGGTTSLTTDQRGATRVIGSAVDIGAVEVQDTVVRNLNDAGAGSLRETINFVIPGSSITFTNTLSGQTLVLTNGQLYVDQNFDIDASALAGGIIIDGNANGRIFEIAANTMNIFDSLTLTNGLAAGDSPSDRGGAIYVNDGAGLTLNNSILTGNTATYGGGSYGGTLNHCTLFRNTANNSGGGSAFGTLNHGTLFRNTANNGGGGSLGGTLNNCTLSGNTGGTLGGGSLEGTLNNCTLSGNTADSGGGSLGGTLNNCTLSGNTADTVGGGCIGGTLNNCIVYFNTSGDGVFWGSDNHFEATFSYSCSTPQPDGTGNMDADPQLAPLGNYGGPTLTMPPLPGSPVIDAGGATSLTTDQRGFPRVLASGPGIPSGVDIGAVEHLGAWIVGADVSGVDPALLLPGSVYDETTLFPVGFSPATAGMLRIQTQAELAALVAQGEAQGEANVTSNPTAYGLYTESAFQALALDRPFLTHNAASNTFTLTIGIMGTPDLISTPFTNLTGFTTIPYPGDGQIDIEFDAPNSEARFFEVYGTEPAL